jgi:hypothetical protein
MRSTLHEDVLSIDRAAGGETVVQEKTETLLKSWRLAYMEKISFLVTKIKASD